MPSNKRPKPIEERYNDHGDVKALYPLHAALP